MFKSLCLVGVLLHGTCFASDIELWADPERVASVVTKFQVTTLREVDLIIEGSPKISYASARELIDDEIVTKNDEAFKIFVKQGGNIQNVSRSTLVYCINNQESIEFLQKIGFEFCEEDIQYAYTSEIADLIRETINNVRIIK